MFGTSSATFGDSVMIKQVYGVFWFSIIILIVLGNLSLAQGQLYVLRIITICFGVTSLCTGLLLKRCYRHWITPTMELYMKRKYTYLVNHMPGSSTIVEFDGSRVYAMSYNTGAFIFINNVIDGIGNVF